MPDPAETRGRSGLLRRAMLFGAMLSVWPLLVRLADAALGPGRPGLGPALGLTLLGQIALAYLLLRDLTRSPSTGAGPRLWPALWRESWRDPAETLPSPGAPPDSAAIDRAILDALPDPVLVLSRDRALAYANQAARTSLGGEIPALLRHPSLRGAIDRAQTEAGATDRVGVETVDLLLPVPVIRDLHATVIDLGPAQSRIALVFADRTRARAVERMRADFVTNASHELRTPLASLIGFVETLRGPAADDPPAQQRFLSIMADQAARMNRLIDDLLSLSRIELSEHMPPSARIDLLAVLDRACQGFEPRCAAALVTLCRDIPDPLPHVLADPDQIEQVLVNLLDNALKYGGERSTITVRLARAAGDRWPARPGLVLSVRDTGPGIPRAHLPRLTERFYRVDRGRSRAAGGTGLGLAIVKHIVNRHRGQLVIDSVEGEGSQFSVWLPVAG